MGSMVRAATDVNSEAVPIAVCRFARSRVFRPSEDWVFLNSQFSIFLTPLIRRSAGCQPSFSAQQRRNLFGSQLPGFPDLEIADRNRADRHSHQLEDLCIERFHHPAHLTVATLGDGDLKDCLAP